MHLKRLSSILMNLIYILHFLIHLCIPPRQKVFYKPI